MNSGTTKVCVRTSRAGSISTMHTGSVTSTDKNGAPSRRAAAIATGDAAHQEDHVDESEQPESADQVDRVAGALREPLLVDPADGRPPARSTAHGAARRSATPRAR